MFRMEMGSFMMLDGFQELREFDLNSAWPGMSHMEGTIPPHLPAPILTGSPPGCFVCSPLTDWQHQTANLVLKRWEKTKNKAKTPVTFN